MYSPYDRQVALTVDKTVAAITAVVIAPCIHYYLTIEAIEVEGGGEPYTCLQGHLQDLTMKKISYTLYALDHDSQVDDTVTFAELFLGLVWPPDRYVGRP